ncbi:carboxymuconolactone decarboxylase family protein [Ensifer sp. 4252]|uniref:carboxymuconolactone decarboxylase family protein n=1 Tax=Ensifer sp. 4252 TaxID=3373915 RepID=UPI003D25A091
MTRRINFAKESPDLMKKFMEFVVATKDNAVAQLNNCTFCLDMHIKQAKIHGERELRLCHLASWRESTLFAPRERAALAWAEIVTNPPELGVPDDIYERVRSQLSEKEVSDLTFVVMSANAWTRVNTAFKTVPGSCDAMLDLHKADLK